jgi:16S rRNA processing protein RimM
MRPAPGPTRIALARDGARGATLEVGVVARAHGVRGELKVALHWAESDALQPDRELILVGGDGSERSVTVDGVRPANRSLLVKLRGIDDKDAADALRGFTIHVFRADLPAPGPNEYYLSDLIGATVLFSDRVIGEVVEVRTHPTVDSIVIRDAEGKLVEQPLAEHWIEQVDVAAGQIRLSSTDGLIE